MNNKNGTVKRPRKLNYVTFILGLAVAVGICYFIPKDKPEVIPPKIESKVIYDTIIIDVTNYRANIKECGNNFEIKNKDTLFICSSGKRIKKNEITKSRICGFSREILKKYKINWHDTIEILYPAEISGKYFVETTTKKTIKNRCDLLFPDNQVGDRWKNCKILIKN